MNTHRVCNDRLKNLIAPNAKLTRSRPRLASECLPTHSLSSRDKIPHRNEHWLTRCWHPLSAVFKVIKMKNRQELMQMYGFALPWSNVIHITMAAWQILLTKCLSGLQMSVS
jgi:hypothetical protein